MKLPSRATMSQFFVNLGLGLRRLVLPSFFYIWGVYLSFVAMAKTKLVGFISETTWHSRIIQEWLIYFDSGIGLDLGRVLEETSRSSTAIVVVPELVFAIVFLILAYKLTPK